MPIYSFFCEQCNSKFEVTKSMDEAGSKQSCLFCKKSKGVFRDFEADNVSISEGLKTLGAIADRNALKLSKDEQHHIKLKTRSQNEV